MCGFGNRRCFFLNIFAGSSGIASLSACISAVDGIQNSISGSTPVWNKTKIRSANPITGLEK